MITYMIKSKTTGKFVIKESSYIQEFAFCGSASVSCYEMSSGHNLQGLLTFESIENAAFFIENLHNESIYFERTEELISELKNLTIVVIPL